MSAVTQDIQPHAFRDLAGATDVFWGQDVLRLEWFQCYLDLSEVLVLPKKVSQINL